MARGRTEKEIEYDVDSNGCWNCTSHDAKSTGYPKAKRYEVQEGIHRIMYRQHILNGNKIPDDLYVLHTCDNTMCINPEHLFLGTHKENMDDMYNKGRGTKAKGENSGLSKLTDQQVIEIRNITTETHKSIAIKYNVDRSLVSLIKANKVWKHLL